jgi:integrase
MSSVEKRPGRKKPWLARYVTPEGRSRAPGFATRKEAVDFLTTVDSDKLAGSYVDPRLGGDRTVRQWGEEWFPVQSFKRVGTGKKVAYALRCLYDLEAVDGTDVGLGDRKLREVQQLHVEAWLNALKERYRPNTVSNIWGGAASLFKAAVVNRRITFSPFYGVQLRLDDTPDIVVPTVEEIMAIHAHLPERWRDMALFQAQTGLRPGEVVGLNVEQLVLRTPQPYVKVDRQLTQAKLVPYTKTKNSFGREVPLDPGTKALIAAHLLRFPLGANGRVFPVNNPRTAWAKAVAKAGIERQVRMHDMRHFYASQLYADTRDWVLVAKRLGDTVATTQRIYTKVVPQSEERARGAMDRVFAPVRVQTMYKD